jgi:asparagine synthase (glutamine-hydrolysing)
VCGICGKVSFGGGRVGEELLSAMCRKMARRGPDDERVVGLEGAGLGQRRLAIIDLNRSAAPPLANEDESVHVVLNGEIYNYRELRDELTARGHRLRTASDTEVIVHLYEEFGEECVRRMRGMFAFAVWDERRGRLFAARDRVGKKPFFYARTGRSFVFASTIQALLADPEVSRDPDFQALDEFFTWRCVPSPATAFQAIRKLPPAHTLTCDADGNVTTNRYWSVPTSGATASDAEGAEERLSAILRESVRLRMIADVPLGAFLSGGIDSGLVVSYMAELSARPVETFSIGFDDPSRDERAHARLVAERYGTEHHEMVVQPDVAEVLPMLMREYGEPFADSSAVPSYYVAKMARERVTVALSGDGGDESFGGYEHYGQQLRWAVVDRAPLGVRGPVAKGLARALDALPHHRWVARASRGFYNLGGTLAERYRLQHSCWKPQEKQALYSRWFRAEVGRESAAGTEDADGLTPLAWMSRHDLTHYLPDCLMVKVDVASMANSLEARCPLLDHHVIEFAAGLPDAWKRQGETGKVILRSLARKRLPAEVVDKRKTGFSIPQGAWLRNPLADFTRGVLLDDDARRHGLFRHDFVETLLREHAAGKRDWSNRLWSLLCFELWRREFGMAGVGAAA